MIDLDVKLSGPVFDGRAARAVDDWLQASEEEIAQAGVHRVKARLGSVLRNPTGEYESRITTDRQRDDSAVTDLRSVKGPWLEGTSFRNQTTRFKGYRTFRLVAQELQDDAAQIAEQLLRREFLGRMQ